MSEYSILIRKTGPDDAYPNMWRWWVSVPASLGLGGNGTLGVGTEYTKEEAKRQAETFAVKDHAEQKRKEAEAARWAEEQAQNSMSYTFEV